MQSLWKMESWERNGYFWLHLPYLLILSKWENEEDSVAHGLHPDKATSQTYYFCRLSIQNNEALQLEIQEKSSRFYNRINYAIPDNLEMVPKLTDRIPKTKKTIMKKLLKFYNIHRSVITWDVNTDGIHAKSILIDGNPWELKTGMSRLYWISEAQNL